MRQTVRTGAFGIQSVDHVVDKLLERHHIALELGEDAHHLEHRLAGRRRGVEALLVGDSVAMVVHGFPSTVHATPEMMVLHTAAVRRGAPEAMIIADMPFLSVRRGVRAAVEGAGGLFSPLGERVLNADLARDFGLPLVVVDSARLGAIGRTLATVCAARASGL